jgi:hypothetical protein
VRRIPTTAARAEGKRAEKEVTSPLTIEARAMSQKNTGGLSGYTWVLRWGRIQFLLSIISFATWAYRGSSGSQRSHTPKFTKKMVRETTKRIAI